MEEARGCGLKGTVGARNRVVPVVEVTGGEEVSKPVEGLDVLGCEQFAVDCDGAGGGGVS